MKKLHFEYYMKIDYSIEVARCNFTIKCIPQTNARQLVENLDIIICPPTKHCNGVDGLGNKQIYGLNDIPHNKFYFKISGDVTAGNADYEEASNDDIAMIFNHAHGLNEPGEKIKAYYETLKLEGVTNREKANEMMTRLYSDYTYESGATNIKTTAEEAFALGKGVCQDYAHIFIALLHLARIPARYVTGLIIGEGQSHAWVEILEDGRWYGYDPTNNEIVDDKHIKIGIGRDAYDCTINRGIMHGGGLHTQTISVNVTEMKEVI